ncbi:MAG: NAD(P)-dependent oxidoreductase [Desulfatirhabdiaceae bacterium]
MKKLLITGAGGFLGQAICQKAIANWRIFGTVRSSRMAISGIHEIQVDLTRHRDVMGMLDSLKPDAVIHAAAIADPNACELKPAESKRINVDAAVTIAGWCADHRILLAFTSSDLVFDGLHAPYREADAACPINRYGEYKVLAEEKIRNIYPETAICRLSLMYGNRVSSRYEPMTHILKSGGTIRLFTDEFRTPMFVETAADGILLCLEKTRGLVHLGGGERISRYEFGRLLARFLGVSENRIIACSQIDIPMPSARPPDVSLNITLARKKGFNPPALIEVLRSFVANPP